MAVRHRRPYPHLAATLMVLAAGALGACGDGSSDSRLLSRSSASDLRSTLAQVEQSVDSSDCEGAKSHVSVLEQQIASLDRVDADLRDALSSGAVRLQQLVSDACQTPTQETGATGSTGTTDTGGTTGDEGAETDEPGKSEGKGKGKKKGHKKDEPSVEIVPDAGTGGADGNGGTTDSGGVAP